MATQAQGLIIKATGGFYYVQTENGLYECRARGLFRKENITPYVGDKVELEPTGEDSGYITAILPRSNSLVRPPLANIHRLAVVLSTARPAPNLLVADTMCAIAQRQGVQPAIIITKADLQDPTPLVEIYTAVGYEVLVTSTKTGQGINEAAAFLKGHITALSGNSGVGKSSLLNAIDPNLNLSTNEISDKLGRGKHTTRHVELHPIAGGGFVADTPGFSALEIEQIAPMPALELQHCFPEFAPYLDNCRFTGCAHLCEKGCAVLEAMHQGEIPESRHKSYTTLYERLKKIKEWELK